MSQMKMALTALLARFANQRDGGLWNADRYGDGDTMNGFITTYDVDKEALDAEIDAFCATFEKGNQK